MLVLYYCTVLEIYITTPIYEPTNKNYGGLLARQDGPVEHENDIGLPLPAVCVPSACVVPSWLCIAMIWKLGATYNLYTYQPDA